jgi:hypothetical protein
MFHLIVCDVDAIDEFFDQALFSKEILLYVDMYYNISTHKSDIKRTSSVIMRIIVESALYDLCH